MDLPLGQHRGGRLISEEQQQLRMYDLRMQLIIEKFSEIVICDFGGHDSYQAGK